MHKLGIHHLTALETDPLAFISIAAETGCQAVSLFFQPIGSRAGFPLVSRENAREVAARLRDTGIALNNVESFTLTPSVEVSEFLPALELGAELGARGAVALLYDSDESRVVDNLGALCATAAALGLRLSIEFMPLTPAWTTLPAAVDLVRRVAHPALAVGVDVLHLVRSGGSPADVAALDPALVGYAQLCDGADLAVTADYVDEAAGDRLAPGDGVFPLPEFLRALPPGTPVELEVPQPPAQPPLVRARHAVDATRRLLEALERA